MSWRIPALGFVLSWACLFAAEPQFDVSPQTALSGHTLRIRAPLQARRAWMNGRMARLFPQSDGSAQGLMPVPAEEPPGIYKVHFMDARGAPVHLTLVTVRDAHYRKQNITMGKDLTELRPSTGEADESRAFRQTVSEVKNWSEPLQAPLSGCMTSRFGVGRLHNGKATGNYHAGIDQRGLEGTPIHAVAGGVVKLVRKWNMHGNTVGIDHGQGLQSMYLHMSRFGTEEGATVKQGDVIGYVGSTGRSTAPHLHWSLYVNSVPVNPEEWVPLSECVVKKKSRKR